ncbi:hypothetical protein HF086_009477 [Spodoptera exigua]|uniref:Tyrosine specific protein phosphatases domain-containing protein n=1 Tax=Spodoptera exigua TaxID=7107 RepID=A0A922MGG5_SPOEX|nr:hypothetical protein HF086_009477 [Spodoptera exigua]
MRGGGGRGARRGRRAGGGGGAGAALLFCCEQGAGRSGTALAADLLHDILDNNQHVAPTTRQPHTERAAVQVPAPTPAALPQAVAAHIG